MFYVISHLHVTFTQLNDVQLVTRKLTPIFPYLDIAKYEYLPDLALYLIFFADADPYVLF